MGKGIQLTDSLLLALRVSEMALGRALGSSEVRWTRVGISIVDSPPEEQSWFAGVAIRREVHLSGSIQREYSDPNEIGPCEVQIKLARPIPHAWGWSSATISELEINSEMYDLPEDFAVPVAYAYCENMLNLYPGVFKGALTNVATFSVSD